MTNELEDKILLFLAEGNFSVPKIAKQFKLHKRFIEVAMKSLSERNMVEYAGGRMWKLIIKSNEADA